MILDKEATKKNGIKTFIKKTEATVKAVDSKKQNSTVDSEKTFKKKVEEEKKVEKKTPSYYERRDE